MAKPVIPSVAGFNAGTLGAWVKYWLSQEPAFLTNGHVLPMVAVDVYHPNVGGQCIGAVLDSGYNNRIDAAIGKCAPEVALVHATKDIGADFTYRGFAAPVHDEAVAMVGAVSGLGLGEVNLTRTHAHYGATSYELVLWREHQNWGVHGDSGSVLLNSSEDIVGIFWGMSGNRHYFHSIIDVVNILRIEPL